MIGRHEPLLRLRSAFVTALAFVCISFSGVAGAAQVTVSEAWTRATVPGQTVAGIYFDIVSAVDAKLVGVDTAIARVAELHLMRVEDGTMRMRAVPAVELPAGKTVSFKPGGYHVMLFDLKRPLRAGERIVVQVSVQDVNGEESKPEIEVDVRNLDGSKFDRKD